MPIAAAIWRMLRSAMPVSRAWSTAAARRRSRACEVAIPECTNWYVYQMVHMEGQMVRVHVEAESLTRAGQAVWEPAAAWRAEVIAPGGAGNDGGLQ